MGIDRRGGITSDQALPARDPGKGEFAGWKDFQQQELEPVRRSKCQAEEACGQRLRRGGELSTSAQMKVRS